MNELLDRACAFLAPLWSWERLRHPWAGWTRLGLGILFPFVIWSHDLFLIVLLVVAMAGLPWWFSPYVEVRENEPLMTKLIDAFQEWMERKNRETLLLAFWPGLALALPLICALWQHNLFWSVYFFLAVAGYKFLFCRHLLGHLESENEPEESGDDELEPV